MDDIERMILDERIRQIGRRFYEKDFHFSNNSEMDILMMLPYLCQMTVQHASMCFVIVCDEDNATRTIASGRVHSHSSLVQASDFIECY